MRWSPVLLVSLSLALTVVGGVVAAWHRGDRSSPVAWQPSDPQPLRPDLRLRSAERFAEGLVAGPEDVAIDPQGRVVVGDAQGRIQRVRVSEGDESVETLVETGGRPLGLAWDPEGALLICDADRGLLRWTEDGGLRTLSTAADGLPFGFTNDVDVGPDGVVYFSDASWRYGIDDYVVDLLDGHPRGRLLRYDPVTRETSTLLSELAFANGVAVDPSGDYLLVAETWRYRVLRYWLRGPRAGQAEPFIEGLDGFPDGVSAVPADEPGPVRFWVALFAPRRSISDFVASRPNLRRVVLGLPRESWPQPRRAGLVLGLDADGAVIETLADPSGDRVWGVTSVEQRGGQLYLGNLHEPHLARVGVPR